MKKIFPITITSHIVECKNFYSTFFGFETVFEADWYIHMKNDTGVEIAFMLPHQQNQPSSIHEPYNGNGIVYSFEVDDANLEYEKMKEKNADFIYNLTDEEWGQRHFMMKDPSGMIIDVVQQL